MLRDKKNPPAKTYSVWWQLSEVPWKGARTGGGWGTGLRVPAVSVIQDKWQMTVVTVQWCECTELPAENAKNNSVHYQCLVTFVNNFYKARKSSGPWGADPALLWWCWVPGISDSGLLTAFTGGWPAFHGAAGLRDRGWGNKPEWEAPEIPPKGFRGVHLQKPTGEEHPGLPSLQPVPPAHVRVAGHHLTVVTAHLASLPLSGQPSPAPPPSRLFLRWFPGAPVGGARLCGTAKPGSFRNTGMFSAE